MPHEQAGACANLSSPHVPRPVCTVYVCMYVHRLSSSDPIGDYVKGANGRVVIVTSRYSAVPAQTILVTQTKHVLRVCPWDAWPCTV